MSESIKLTSASVKAKLGYRPQAMDTSVESDIYQFSLLRQRTAAHRLAMATKLTSCAKRVSLRGIKGVKNSFEDVKVYFARAVLGEKWEPKLIPKGQDETLWIQDSIELARQLHPILESLSIPYYVTGGVASIAYGEPRTTRDLDLVIQIEPMDITRLSNVLEQEGFYCPPSSIEDIQIGRGRTLSITHTETILNADIVVSQNTNFDQSKMERRQLVEVDENTSIWLASPEDIVLAKLLWGRQSQSEKQWRDVLGVLKVQEENLDYGYLNLWSEDLGLSELLDQALQEAGIEI